MNIFEDYIKSGKITSKEELKKYFWVLAKNVHPDVTTIEYSENKFIKLKEDFDEALLLLPPINEAYIPKYSHEKLRDIFQDIVARGFPIAIEFRTKVKAYINGIQEYSKLIDHLDENKGFDFSDVERELYQIRGNNIIQNDLFGNIKMIFYNVVTYYYEPILFAKSAILKIFNEIQSELIKKKYFSVKVYIEWLIKNLDNM